MDKSHFMKAYENIGKIEDLLSEAGDLCDAIEPGILQAVLDCHNENATLPYCLRWGLQAAKEIREDWHTVVSNIPGRL